MVKVTLNAPPAARSPGAALVAAPTVTDALGRKLALREPTLLQEQDLLGAMPPSHSNSPLALGRALLALRISSIDGVAIDPCLTVTGYRAMIQQVGREGIDAVLAAQAPETAPEGDDELVEKAKNLSGTPAPAP